MGEKRQDKGNKISPLIAERRRIGLEMRQAGHTYLEIAHALGFKDEGTAYNIVKKALKATYQQPADEVRKLELERLDRLTNAVWGKARGGDVDAMDRVIKLMDRRARLLGLDAPEKRAITVEPVKLYDVTTDPDAM